MFIKIWRTICCADEREDGKIDINDVTVPYDREEEEVENAIHEDIEADTVTNDLRKEITASLRTFY